MTKKHKVKCDMYPLDFIFIDSDSRDEIWKDYAAEYNELGGTFSMSDCIFIVVNKKSDKFHIGVFVHECGHAVSETFKSLGIKKDINNDEPEQYLLSWIFNEGYEKLGLYNKKYRKSKK